jgi:hypothetical protein
MKVRRAIAVLAAVTVCAIGLGAAAVYGHGGDATMVHACVNNSSGAVKFVGPNGTCQNNETAVDWDKPSRTEPGTFTVDCDAGETIQNALANLIPGDTLKVSGTCNENVTIREELERITLDGQGTATINGPDSTRNTAQVRGRGITIQGFTITGGNSCINISRGGTATIDSNLIQNAAGLHGISIDSASSATIINNMIKTNAVHGIQLTAGASANIGFRAGNAVASPNTIQNNLTFGINLSDASSARIDGNLITGNGNAGINVSESSSARIGFSGPAGSLTAANTIKNNGNGGIRVLDAAHAGIEGNVIENNTGTGILVDISSSSEIGARGFSNSIQNNSNGGVLVRRSSSARILAAVISNNTGNGIQISRASQADVSNNAISANTQDGIRVEENSGLNLVTPANSGSNGQFGIRCRTGAYATGSIGGLTGTSGQKDFGTTLTVSTVDGAVSTWGPVADGDGTTLSVTGPGSVSINSEGCIDRTTP